MKFGRPFQPFGFLGEDAFEGGITHQLDHHLHALREATIKDDARLYANLVSQIAAILRPKLKPEEYEKFSNPKVSLSREGMRRREYNREYERQLFKVCRDNLSTMLALVATRGLYAKEDASEPDPVDVSDMALTGGGESEVEIE